MGLCPLIRLSRIEPGTRPPWPCSSVTNMKCIQIHQQPAKISHYLGQPPVIEAQPPLCAVLRSGPPGEPLRNALQQYGMQVEMGCCPFPPSGDGVCPAFRVK